MLVALYRAARTLVQSGPCAVVNRAKFRVHEKYNSWYLNNPWILGRLVELRGNRGLVDGLTFSLDSPAIKTRYKSGFFRGDYEAPECALLQQAVDPNLGVVEFGASIGVMACLTNRKLNDRKRHVVVEANALLIPVLENNREINNCGFQIINKAVAYGCDTIDFKLHDWFVGGSVQGARLSVDGQRPDDDLEASPRRCRF